MVACWPRCAAIFAPGPASLPAPYTQAPPDPPFQEHSFHVNPEQLAQLIAGSSPTKSAAEGGAEDCDDDRMYDPRQPRTYCVRSDDEEGGPEMLGAGSGASPRWNVQSPRSPSNKVWGGVHGGGIQGQGRAEIWCSGAGVGGWGVWSVQSPGAPPQGERGRLECSTVPWHARCTVTTPPPPLFTPCPVTRVCLSTLQPIPPPPLPSHLADRAPLCQLCLPGQPGRGRGRAGGRIPPPRRRLPRAAGA